MIDLLVDNPLLLLFVVAALGYLLGRIRIGSFSLGVAAVLFAGLAIGALDEDLELPDLVYQLGLVLFVYTIALASGPAFARSLGGRTLRLNALVGGVLLVCFGMVVGFAVLADLSDATASGLFAGSLTNTPALAGVLETLGTQDASASRLAEPVTAYAIAYPMGVVAMLLAVHFAWRRWGEREAVPVEEVVARTVTVRNEAVVGRRVDELLREGGWPVVFSRLHRGDQTAVVGGSTTLQAEDEYVVVGPRSQVRQVAGLLGSAAPGETLTEDRHDVDFRRILVSNKAVAGRTIADLDLIETYGAVVTRVRRGDVEVVAQGGTQLELGDRLRVVGSHQSLREVAALFGDSNRAVSEIDIISFSVGITLGLLVGLIPVPLPGGATFHLGIAGGPLVVGLLLGMRGRTGPMLWQIPYNANLTIRQLGLVLFLAGVGLRSGYDFKETVFSGTGPLLFLGGAAVTTVAALLVIGIGHRVLRVPLQELTGMLSGFQTQPAVLAASLERSGDDQPNLGYAAVYPLAMLLKIILVQVVLLVL